MILHVIGFVLCVIAAVVFYIYERTNPNKLFGTVIILLIGIIPFFNLLLPLICIISLIFK